MMRLSRKMRIVMGWIIIMMTRILVGIRRLLRMRRILCLLIVMGRLLRREIRCFTVMARDLMLFFY